MKRYFITGLIILLPVAITLFVLHFILNFLTNPFVGFVSKIFSADTLKDFGFYVFTSEQVIRYGSQLIILLALIFLTLGIGLIGKWFLVKAFFHFSERFLSRVPLVNKVYKTTQEIIHHLFVSEKKSFNQVVLVPFFNSYTYAVGLVTQGAPKECNDVAHDEMISVFVPTTPNPATGYLIMYKKSEIFYIEMKTEDAIKYVVSSGVIIPEHLKPNNNI